MPKRGERRGFSNEIARNSISKGDVSVLRLLPFCYHNTQNQEKKSGIKMKLMVDLFIHSIELFFSVRFC